MGLGLGVGTSHLRPLELLVDAREVDRARAPELDLRQRARVLGVLAVVLPVEHLVTDMD